MGLDITYYAHAERLEPQPDEATDDMYGDETLERAFAYNGFEQSLRGLSEGWYRVSGESGHFRAGSYSGYNEFRAVLAHAALGVKPDDVWADTLAFRDRPFFELLNFADNEGTIGPEAAADLAADFRDNRDRILPLLDEWHREKYDQWQHAFETAARGGLVSFG